MASLFLEYFSCTHCILLDLWKCRMEASFLVFRIALVSSSIYFRFCVIYLFFLYLHWFWEVISILISPINIYLPVSQHSRHNRVINKKKTKFLTRKIHCIIIKINMFTSLQVLKGIFTKYLHDVIY